MTLRARLEALLDALPPGGSVTLDREALEELLGAEGSGSEPVADLTVEEVAQELGRAPSTVRGWLGAEDLEGYRLRGREWRVPREALRAFLEEERGNGREETSDLGSWREVSGGSG